MNRSHLGGRRFCDHFSIPEGVVLLLRIVQRKAYGHVYAQYLHSWFVGKN